MGKERKPRRGSMGVRPRKRAEKQTPSVHCWPNVPNAGVLGFAGYKAGMTHVSMIDASPGSATKGQEIVVPATVLEVPPLLVFGLRFYVSTPYGRKVFSDVLFAVDKKVMGALRLSPSAPEKLQKIETELEKISDVSVLAATQPFKTGFGKKVPEVMEIAVGGKNAKEKLEFCKGLAGKEVKAGDVFKEGELVDVIGVTKGKGWQGAVKRFGVALQRRKATGRVRHVGTLGPWHPARVMYTVPMAGQMGYHKRTEHNKQVLKIGEKPEEINPRGGFLEYGVVKGPYVLIKGSVFGPRKRLLRLRKSFRKWNAPAQKIMIKWISLESGQGV